MKQLSWILALTAFFLAIALVFADFFETAGDLVVGKFGLGGVFLAVAALDFLIQPFPPDPIFYSFVLSGYPVWNGAFILGLASVCGGILGYMAGRLLQHEGALRFIKKSKYDKAHALFMRHGFLAVLIGALSPVPFNVICWMAGAFNMPSGRFIASALVTRVPRFFIVGAIATYLT